MTLIRVGFSGSREGMTAPQVQAVYRKLLGMNWAQVPDLRFEGHHGDCLGGDHEFHTLITALGWRTVAHPPVNSRLRAWCKADEIRPPKDYLARDWDIAEETGELLAAPKTAEPYRESGTWTTTGYGVRLARPVTVFLPDGTAVPGQSFFGAPLPGRPAS
jgi:hypothetical protein